MNVEILVETTKQLFFAKIVGDRILFYFGIVAQLEERLLHTQEVIGSRPVGPIR